MSCHVAFGDICHSLVTAFPLANEETSWVDRDPGRGCVSQDVYFGFHGLLR